MGLLAIWNVLVDLHRAHININFAVFLLPVGVGLICGKKSSRGWATFWCILGLIFCVFLAGLSGTGGAYFDYFGTRLRGEEAAPYVLLVAGLGVALDMFVLTLLHTRRSNEYFSKHRENGDFALENET